MGFFFCLFLKVLGNSTKSMLHELHDYPTVFLTFIDSLWIAHHALGPMSLPVLSHPIHSFLVSSIFESLVGLEASGFWYTTANGLSLGIFLDILFSCVMEILLFWISRLVPFTCFKSLYILWILGWADS